MIKHFHGCDLCGRMTESKYDVKGWVCLGRILMTISDGRKDKDGVGIKSLDLTADLPDRNPNLEFCSLDHFIDYIKIEQKKTIEENKVEYRENKRKKRRKK